MPILMPFYLKQPPPKVVANILKARVSEVVGTISGQQKVHTLLCSD